MLGKECARAEAKTVGRAPSVRAVFYGATRSQAKLSTEGERAKRAEGISELHG